MLNIINWYINIDFYNFQSLIDSFHVFLFIHWIIIPLIRLIATHYSQKMIFHSSQDIFPSINITKEGSISYVNVDFQFRTFYSLSSLTLLNFLNGFLARTHPATLLNLIFPLDWIVKERKRWWWWRKWRWW